MASFTAGTTFTDGVANDVTAAKLAALVNAATPTSGLIQDRTAETTIAADDTLLIGDASDSNNLKRITVANFNNVVTTGTGTAASPAIVPTGDTNTGIFFPAADTIAFSEGGAEAMRIDSSGNVGIGTASPSSVGGLLSTVASSNVGTGFFRNLATSGITSDQFQVSVSQSANLANFYFSRFYSDVVSSPTVKHYVRGDGDGYFAGNVGIGILSPATKLHVFTESPTAANEVARFQGGSNSSNFRNYISLYTTNPNYWWELSNQDANGGASTNGLAFRERSNAASVERVYIAQGGNVGIGTASPATKLHVEQGTTDSGITVTNDSGGYKGRVYFDYNTNQFVIDSNGDVDARQANGTNNGTGALALYTALGTGLGGTGASTEKMRITGAGNVGIGTTSPSAQLELSTDSAKKPSTNTWTIASDQRLKTNITNADNDRCYEIVKQVPLKRYTWKNEIYSQDKVKDRSKLGWIAQDVEAVFPKAVGTNRFAYNQVFEDVVTPELDSDGNAVLDENGVAKTKTEKRLVSEDVIEDCKDLNSDQIYAAMYGTIQKLIEKVETLEAKVAVLEAA